MGEKNDKNQQDGLGVKFWEDGSIYCGNWCNGVVAGKGRFLHPNGDIYEGQWEDGKANGYGTFYHTDGTRY